MHMFIALLELNEINVIIEYLYEIVCGFLPNPRNFQFGSLDEGRIDRFRTIHMEDPKYSN